MKILGREIGPGNRSFLILEAGINHNGDMKLIQQMVAVAKEVGADALKFQTFKASEFVSDSSQTYTYCSQGKPVTESMLAMFQRYELTATQWAQTAAWCADAGILFLSTPQNPTDLDFLLSIVDLPAIKVGSDDLTNLELLAYYAAKKRPMIISAGMAYLSEVEAAVRTVHAEGNYDLAVLHCVSSYPAQPEELNLRKILTIGQAFQVPVGFSDHTIGANAASVAVALGASIVEKHFTIDKNLPGPDHWFSSDPQEAREWVETIRNTESALGTGIIQPTEKELAMRLVARRSLVATRDLPAGTVLSREDLTFKRPGSGLPPAQVGNLVGLRLLRPVKNNALVTFDDVRA